MNFCFIIWQDGVVHEQTGESKKAEWTNEKRGQNKQWINWKVRQNAFHDGKIWR